MMVNGEMAMLWVAYEKPTVGPAVTAGWLWWLPPSPRLWLLPGGVELAALWLSLAPRPAACLCGGSRQWCSYSESQVAARCPRERAGLAIAGVGSSVPRPAPGVTIRPPVLNWQSHHPCTPERVCSGATSPAPPRRRPRACHAHFTSPSATKPCLNGFRRRRRGQLSV